MDEKWRNFSNLTFRFPFAISLSYYMISRILEAGYILIEDVNLSIPIPCLFGREIFWGDSAQDKCDDVICVSTSEQIKQIQRQVECIIFINVDT